MAFGVGSKEDQTGFDDWFPDIKSDPIELLIDKLNNSKLLAHPKFGYYIDMGGEFYIYEGSSEKPKNIIYTGNIHGFISELMQYFNVKDDN